MSWPFKTLLVSGLLLLVSCGFQPMYGDHGLAGKNSPLRGNLVISQIPGREGQLLRIALEDRFNPEGIASAHPDYRLHIGLRKTLIPAVMKSDGTIQRYDIHIDSDFRLIQASDGKVVLMGQLRRIGSYNVATNANFATYEAEQDIIERTVTELAEDFVLRVSGYFAGKK